MAPHGGGAALLGMYCHMELPLVLMQSLPATLLSAGKRCAESPTVCSECCEDSDCPAMSFGQK